MAKIAGAPIPCGVCEVPGWGPMLPTSRVLRELRSFGLDTIECYPHHRHDDAPVRATSAAGPVRSAG